MHSIYTYSQAKKLPLISLVKHSKVVISLIKNMKVVLVQVFEFFAFLGLFLFALATVMVFSQLRNSDWNLKLRTLAWYTFVGGTIALCISSFYVHLRPEFSSIQLYFVTTTAVIVCLLGGIFQSSTLALLGSPFVTIVLVSSIFSHQGEKLPIENLQPVLSAHIIFAILGSCLAVAASLIAIIYLLQNSALKSGATKKMLPGLPSLETLGSLLNTLLWLCIISILVSLLTGAHYTYHFLDILSISMKTKIIWSIAVFGWFSFILILKSFKDIQVTTTAKLTIVGFAILSTAFFGLWFGPLG